MKKELKYAYNKYCSYTSKEIKEDFPNFMGALSFFVEQISNSDGETLKEFLLEEIKKDIFMPPPWIRLIIVRNIMYQSPNDKDFFNWASGDLSLFYHPQSPIILELEEKAKS